VADAELAKATLERARALRKGGANTPVELEAAEARAKQTQAIVANIQATITKKTIRAPFDGRVAMKQVERGQVVSPGTPIATLQSVDPIFAEFSLPQQALADLKTGQTATMRVDSFPGKTWQGTISTVNSEVDSATRNIRVRATFPNKEGILRPGLVRECGCERLGPAPRADRPGHRRGLCALWGLGVRSRAEEADDHKAGDQEGGDPHPALVAQPRFVRLGERRGDLVAVVSGLKEGETVVSNGAFKLRKGMSGHREQYPGTTGRARSQANRQIGREYELIVKITDLFIRRPVLAIVVNLVILIAGIAGRPLAECAAIPAQRKRGHHRHHRLCRRQRRAGARLHHDAARTLHRGRRRHRLHRVAKPAERVDHPRAPAPQLRFQPRAGRDQRQGESGARRLAPGGRDPGHQHRNGRQPVRLRLPELLVPVPQAERDYRLSGAGRATAAFGH
jgi:hypothetical protein